jgi:hypothetical protein
MDDNSPPTDDEIGKAYKAFSAYNFKYKSGRVEFDLVRWIKVIRSISADIRIADTHPQEKQPHSKTGWARHNNSQ